MNFTSRNLASADSFKVQQLGTYTKTGSCSVFEKKTNVAIETTIYTDVFSNSGLPTTPESYDSGKFVRIPKSILTDERLTEVDNDGISKYVQVASFTGLIPYIKYRFFCNSILDLNIVSAHYGQYYCGGIEFDLQNAIASSDTDYAYQIDFSVIDLQLLQRYAKFDVIQISQNLMFDIATYSEDRRIDYSTVFTDSLYSKLGIRLSIEGSELRIECKDSAGNSVSDYVQNTLNISNTTMTCLATVRLTANNENGEAIQEYGVNIANINYDDAPIMAYLPQVSDDAVIVVVNVIYTVTLYTTSESITLSNTLILTDQQIAALRPLHLSDL